jgi:hypothetical protein
MYPSLHAACITWYAYSSGYGAAAADQLTMAQGAAALAPLLEE